MPKLKTPNLQDRLLNWFDRHRRVMPWRAAKGHRPDPYHVWLSEIMLQQTTVVTVGPYFMKFIGKWPTVQKLAKAKLDDVLAAWAGLGYYARARNLHKCAMEVSKRGGFPQIPEELIELPGIGPYTAAAIASIAFDIPAVAVDGNVERVVSRYFAITEPLPLSKEDIRAGAAKLAKGVKRPGDFTQAFMELGATVCTPRNPKCGQCPWHDSCAARAQGIADELPRKLAKKARPVRYGKVFCMTNAKGEVLIEKRTEKGLYEGMYQLPTTEWTTDKAAARKLPVPFAGAISTGETVRHTFTHFDLVLELWVGVSGQQRGGTWVSPRKMAAYALPTLMTKALKLALGDGKLEKKAV